MKRNLLLTLLIVIALSVSVILTSCLEGIEIPGVTDTPSTEDGKDDDQTTDEGGNNTDTVKKEMKTVTFRYNGATVHTLEIESGNKIDKDELVAELAKKDLTFNGFFTDSALKTEFDFNTEITNNVKVFCRNSYVVKYYYGDEVILVQHVDKEKKFFTQAMADEKDALRVGNEKFTGIYTTPDADIDPKELGDTSPVAVEFDFLQDVTSDLNLYCKRFVEVTYRYGDKNVFKQYVDTYGGFTKKQLDKKDNFLYHGYHFDNYYSDNGCTVAYDYKSIPTSDIVIYCDRDETKAGANVTWRVEEDTAAGTVKLIFEGEGDMYAFDMQDDVPWRNQYYMSINEVVIEEGITSIANFAFSHCLLLTDINLPETLRHIGASAFYKSGIANINFPDSLRSIGEFAFNECTGLVDLKFNAGLENIANGAFYKCSNIKTAVLTDTIISFGTSAFQDCNALSAAYYIGTKEQYDKVDIALDNYWINELAHTYYISETKPSEPGPYWYYDEDGNICQWYYTIWYLESPVHRVPFKVDYVDVDGAITAENVAFQNSIVHKGYKFAGWNLSGDDSGTYFVLTEGETLTSDIKLVGNRGKLCGDNVEWNFNRYTSTLEIKLIDGNISDGAMWDFETVQDAPWLAEYKNRIKNVDIKSGVTHIGKFSFVDFKDNANPYTNFSYIVIPTSVTSIHQNAFSGCDHLLYIYYEGSAADLYGDGTNPAKISGINELNFGSSSAQTRVYAKASEGTTADGAYWTVVNESRVAWIYNSQLKGIVIGGGDSTHSIVDFAIVEQTPWYSLSENISTVAVNANIVSIGSNAFYGMTSVTGIVVTERISKIAATAFEGTGYYTAMYNAGAVYLYTAGTGVKYGHLIKVNPEKLTSDTFIIPEKTISIAENAFDGCANLEKLVLTKDVKPLSIFYYKDVSANVTRTAFGDVTDLEVFFDGLEDAWVENYASRVPAKTVYFYSADMPTANVENYWHWQGSETPDDPTDDVKIPALWSVE
ncbi:MAG: leucine-rich repeat protein [Clostridia bacterium]|nr:leucine-rich repeat protein [Clostridia bacterium]